jgi:1-acyl-sn-glycerol-3-phosphate acyltransferase
MARSDASEVGGRQEMGVPWQMPWRVMRRMAGLGNTWWRATRVGAGDETAISMRRAGESLQRLTGALCAEHAVEMTVEGVAPVAEAVVVANHVSYLDTMILPALMPCTVVAKAEVARWPMIGAAARAHGVLFVERGDPWSGARVLRQAMRVLAAGVPVASFPEGTTTAGSLLPFHRGLFGVARLCGVPVIPVALVFDDPRLAWVGSESFLAHYLRRVAPRRKVGVRVAFLEPILPRELPSAEAVALIARERIGAELARGRRHERPALRPQPVPVLQ